LALYGAIGKSYLLSLLLCFMFLQAGLMIAQEQVPPPQAAPQTAALAEFWEAVYLQGIHVGHAHGLYRPFGKDLIQSQEEFSLNLTRFNQQLRMQFSYTMLEDKAGKIRQFTITQSMGRDGELVRTGKVEDDTVRITMIMGSQAPVTRQQPWNEQALGLYAMEQLYREKKLQPGLEFDFQTFSTDFNTVINYHVKVEDKQPTSLLGGRTLPFWRVIVQVQKIGDVQLLPMICWVNDKGEVYKREQTMPGLGDLTFYRTRKENAVLQASAQIVNPEADIGYSQLIRLNRSFNQFNNTRSVEYR
ncbi:MAG TPA: hypothetical protein PKD72_14585, partial [Gemmatales bacterium]|nr:hypothetical protein [Gemmatales bacterium]